MLAKATGRPLTPALSPKATFNNHALGGERGSCFS